MTQHKIERQLAAVGGAADLVSAALSRIDARERKSGRLRRSGGIPEALRRLARLGADLALGAAGGPSVFSAPDALKGVLEEARDRVNRAQIGSVFSLAGALGDARRKALAAPTY